MTPDPRWLEILKASGWQTAALASAFGLFLLLPHWGLLPEFTPVMKSLAALAFLVCICLAFASIGHTLSEMFVPKAWVMQCIRNHRQRRIVHKYIPFMTDQEKEIIAYLLAKNQKIITADRDGGHAMTLISRGILIPALRTGQVFSDQNCPFIVPDHLWDELYKQKEAFPYKPPPPPRRGGQAERHPWRVPWMAQ